MRTKEEKKQHAHKHTKYVQRQQRVCTHICICPLLLYEFLASASYTNTTPSLFSITAEIGRCACVCFYSNQTTCFETHTHTHPSGASTRHKYATLARTPEETLIFDDVVLTREPTLAFGTRSTQLEQFVSSPNQI